MLQTSGTYNYQSIEIELLIREAYERIGILGEFVELQKLESAKRSIDFLLIEWMNRGVNLWTLATEYLSLAAGQSQYILPETVSDIIQVSLRTGTRQLGGAAATSENGTAASAFDENPATACIQTAPNGNISYDYGVGKAQAVSFIGIKSNVTGSYAITVEISDDNVNWKELFTFPTENFTAGVTVWVDVPVVTPARVYRIRETRGATLSIQEIYFNNNINDSTISDVSRYEYLSYPNKSGQGRPSVYYLDRQIVPILNLWPTPSSNYNCLSYSYKKMIQDTGSLYTNTLQIPSRFYPAAVWGLTWMTALKYKPEQAGLFQAEYERSFALAAEEDTERDTLRIYPYGYYI